MSKGAIRAQQIWQILVSRASNRQTITYGGISELLWNEDRGANTLGQYLNRVRDYCQKKDLPRLTVLVVLQRAVM